MSDALRHLFHAAARTSPLTRLAASWLGRDPFTGAHGAAAVGDAAVAGRDRLPHRRARRYGFHATLKAPFQLAANETEAALGERRRRIRGQRRALRASRALPSARSTVLRAAARQSRLPTLDRFAGDVVKAFDRFRAPLTEAEIERRNPDALSAEEFRNLCQWGYPYVFEAFRFHMTLTGRVAAGEPARVRAALDEVFAPMLAEPVAGRRRWRCSSSRKPARRSRVHSWSRLRAAASEQKDCLK